MNSGLPASAAPLGGVGIPCVKVKFCRYYAKDKTCFYGDECQFLHEEPSMASMSLHSGASPVPLSMSGGSVTYPLSAPPACPVGVPNVPKKGDSLGPAGTALEGQMLTIPGMESGSLSDANLTNSYFSSSFIGVNGFGSPAESKYSIMQRITNSSSSPSLLDDGAKNFSHSAHDPGNSPISSLFSDFGALSISQRRKGPNPTANEFIPKGVPRMATMVQSSGPAFPSPLFPHLGPSSSTALAPGMSLSAGSTPLHSPKITPQTSPAPRRRSHTPNPNNPNPANYMVPTSVSDQGAHIIQKETVGGTTYFYTDNTPAPMAGMVFPTYHIYPPTAPHVAYMQPKANAPSFFMADELRQELINRHLITMAQLDQSENTGVPSEVDSYHSLFPLEPVPPPNRLQKTSNFSYITSCYKAVNSKDDLPYCLRRIHGFRLVNTKCMMLVDMWKKIQQSNSVTLREVFTTKAFGDHSLVFSYDFHAGAETMFSRHFNDPAADSYFTKRKWGQHEPPPPRQHAGLLPESLIWAYIVQLSSALRTIHTAGLACRVMDPSKILITGKTRLRVNCVGVFDVLTFDNSQTNHVTLMPQYQQADLISLGKVVLALACNSLAGIQRENLQKAMELVSINYSSDLKNLILYLLTEQSRLRSVNDIMPMIGARFYTQLDASQMRNDVIEEDLAKEVQNGRLFRLLAKLGTINERPEFQKDHTWSETGDRYLLKLFRDHLFHQVTEAGTPWIDLSHIVSCLNKLDAGVPEKISLVSRDEKSVLVVTYSDLKRCFDNTFQELQQAAAGPL
ncbi:PAN2-PAN3 deadenylation complex subunit pan3-like isoform X2 [Salvelinus fontinalis]|uniref:PAN2-PAN3 deadenylation complex subunit PAN3 n=1 Tax=Salvelinus namaycush TaxID=8040 RepID=A0A8U0R3C9_SALNM|nr:PAN2-PAN3 deadenylation complex subunit pan3-like isoform X2 [Salvelinus namaycush]XP_055784472.1 PAN2-PAN3 deadenylation complex subunit pan3-like isoform X2 [Salvelinus fontinalis]